MIDAITNVVKTANTSADTLLSIGEVKGLHNRKLFGPKPWIAQSAKRIMDVEAAHNSPEALRNLLGSAAGSRQSRDSNHNSRPFTVPRTKPNRTPRAPKIAPAPTIQKTAPPRPV